MATTYPLATLGPTITSSGISIPSYQDVLNSLIASMQAIYGSDAYLQPDSADGQLIAIVAAAVNDANMAAVAIWNQFSPTYAQGVGFSSLVKLNGIQRLVPTFTTVVVTIAGTVGTVIDNGSVGDGTNAYDLPVSVTIDAPGSVDVIATAQQPGNLTAAPGTVTSILTPQLGWQSVTNAGAAVPGNATENDAQLRLRQSKSTTLPAESVLAAIEASIANLVGVTQIAAYENVTDLVDANGAPPHSVYFVVLGGTAQEIVNAIGAKKTLGANTYGTSSGVYTDPVTEIPYTIHYFVPTPVIIAVHITCTALTVNGVNANVQQEITDSLTAYINELGIGQSMLLTRLYAPGYLNGSSDGQLYEITVLQINKNGGGFSGADVAIAYNEIASAGAITITVV